MEVPNAIDSSLNETEMEFVAPEKMDENQCTQDDQSSTKSRNPSHEMMNFQLNESKQTIAITETNKHTNCLLSAAVD